MTLTGRWMSGLKISEAPWLTCGLVAVALVASFAPGMAEAFQYDRAQVEGGGEWWRLMTGQLVHWTARMACVDLGVVLLLGAWLERYNRGLLAAACLAGLLVTGTGIHLLAPQVGISRGASGMATTLFVLLALVILRDRQSRVERGLAALALALIVAKIIWESASSSPLTAGPFPEGVVVLPLAHLLGGLAAVIVFGLSRLRRAIDRPRLRGAGEARSP